MIEIVIFALLGLAGIMTLGLIHECLLQDKIFTVREKYRKSLQQNKYTRINPDDKRQ